jgi:thiol-disulfide isomerase/thioredoxin
MEGRDEKKKVVGSHFCQSRVPCMLPGQDAEIGTIFYTLVLTFAMSLIMHKKMPKIEKNYITCLTYPFLIMSIPALFLKKIVISLSFCACYLHTINGNQSVEEINNADEAISNILKKHKKVVLYAYKEGCPYCKKVTPKVAMLAEEGFEGIEFIKIEKDKLSKEKRDNYEIKTFPTLVFFKDEKKIGKIDDSSDKDIDFFKEKIKSFFKEDKQE